MADKSYRRDENWRVIQCYLPKHNRIHENSQPEEEWLELDKFRIHIDRHQMVKQPKGVVVVFHGLGGNGRISSSIALPICAQGYEVVCPDMPQFGLTECKGTVSYDDWVECGVAVCEKYMEEDLPLYLFGMSASGLLVYQIACRLQRVNAIASTCMLDLRDPVVVRETLHSGLKAKLIKPALRCLRNSFGSKKIPVTSFCKMKLVVNNEELAGIMCKDTLSAGTSLFIEFVYGMFNAHVEIEPEDFTKCPVLIVHPSADRFSDPSLSRIFFDKLKVEKKMVGLDSTGHFMIEKEGLDILEKEVLEFYEKYK